MKKSSLLSKPPRKIVVIQTAYIGDVIFASPLVHAIKETHPQASVSMLVRPSAKEVAQCIPGVDEVLTFDKQGEESGPLGLLRAARRVRRRGFDMLVSPHRSTRSAMLALFSKVPLRVGFRNGLGKLAYHVAVRPKPEEPCTLNQNLEMLSQIGIKPAGTRLRLRGPLNHAAYVQDFLARNRITTETKMVALCIGAFWPTKQWPPVYFASLAESLRERGYRPVLFGGPNERGIATAIEAVLKEPLTSCVGNTLAEAAVLLERCELAVGGDSGLTHMARALAIPTVVIYGPTDPRMHCFGEKTKVLMAKVKCRPCSRHGQGSCPERHHDCMRLVSPEDVMTALKEIANLQTPVGRLDKKEKPDRLEVATLAL